MTYAQYSPTATGVNIWNVPIDIYTSLNQDAYNGNVALISNCSTSVTIRSCIQGFLASWRGPGGSQPVTGIRFFLGVTAPVSMPASYFSDPSYPSFVPAYTPSGPTSRDGNYSHPWIWSGSAPVMSPAWASNLALFFDDLAYYGMKASITLGLNPQNAFLTSEEKDCTGTYNLKFLPWIPYGFLYGGPADGFEDCEDNNDAYSTWANANPYFWGWAPFEFPRHDDNLVGINRGRFNSGI